MDVLKTPYFFIPKSDNLMKKFQWWVILICTFIGGSIQSFSLSLGPPLEKILEYIEKEYIKEANETTLTEAAIIGILRNLDPYCRYLNPQAFLQWRYQSLGELGGVGIEIEVEAEGLRIMTVYEDTPAYKAFITEGDLITKIDHIAINEKGNFEKDSLMLGPIGSTVTLEIQRPDRVFTISLQREAIQISPLRWYTEREIGYIRMNTFDSRTESALNHALHQMKEHSSNLQGLILDLRNNTGGTLESAIHISDAFLDQGTIVTVKGKADKYIERYDARPGDILQGLPMVVLINNGSASASEIVAGALQDRKRAQIVGTPSYGKGVGQKMIPLENGGAIFLTVEQYYTPKGKQINGVGIQPDFIVLARREFSENAENSNLKYGSASLKKEGVLRRESFKDGCHFEKTPYFVEYDYQLQRAIDLLRTQCFLKNSTEDQ